MLQRSLSHEIARNSSKLLREIPLRHCTQSSEQQRDQHAHSSYMYIPTVPRTVPRTRPNGVSSHHPAPCHQNSSTLNWRDILPLASTSEGNQRTWASSCCVRGFRALNVLSSSAPRQHASRRAVVYRSTSLMTKHLLLETCSSPMPRALW